MERTPIEAGITLGERYRVERHEFDTPADGGRVFSGHDRVLDRPIFVFPLAFTRSGDVTSFAARFAQIHHAGLVQIYDAGPGWLVCEYPGGGRLADRLVAGSITQADAARACRDIVRAVRALHEHGIAHGAVTEDLVLFDEEDRAKLAVAGIADPSMADDVTAVAELVRRVFSASKGAGRKRALPAPVAAVVDRMLAPGAATRPDLRELQGALEALVPSPHAERPAGFFRQEARWLIPVIGIVLAAVVAVLVGLRIEVGGKGFPIKIGREPAAAARPYVISSVHDFDPPPAGNGSEHPDQAPLASDGNDLTQWLTQGYASEALGGKPGVGLVFDLGAARRVGRIVVRTSLPGWTAEWRAADQPGAAASDFSVATEFTTAETGTTVKLRPARAHRFWLLWITKLVRNETGTQSSFPFQAAVADVSFFAA